MQLRKIKEINPDVVDLAMVSEFSKGNHDIDTGSERSVIWKYCLEELLDSKPIHFWGYGEYVLL